MKITEEQKEIIFSTENSVSVISAAGSGKTTTLVEYAKENFERNILCVMFNKDLREKTRRRMPVNCEVHTINSLAFKYSKYKKSFIMENITVLEIMDMLKINDIDNAFRILNDYISFTNSGEVSWSGPGYDIYNMLKTKKYKIDHAFILKEFSLSAELLNLTYDIIMVDEAQDTNPVMLFIINMLKHKKEIFVGDPKQSIYDFRNNVSIFNVKQSDITFSLSKSFRFGPEIAEYVNDINKKMYGVDNSMIIQGNDQINSKITDNNSFGFNSAYISRTNAHLFEKAIEYSLLDFCIAIPFDWIELKESLYNMLYLKLGMRNKITNKIFLKYKNYELFKRSIKFGFNVELSYLTSIIDKYGISIIEYINILENSISSPKFADISLITTHKAKGMEFLYTELGTDFKLVNNEEKNLIYVAATRAALEMNTFGIQDLFKK